MSSLLELSLTTVAVNIERYKDLECLPDDLSQILFQLVLEKNKLSPTVLKKFTQTGNPGLLQHIKSLNLRDTPVLLKTPDHLWLGDKCNLY